MEQRGTAEPLLNKIRFPESGEFWLAFKSGCTVGIIVHFYMLSNLLINHDGIVCFVTENWFLESGRWAISFFSKLSGQYELPVVIGLLSILALALTAAVTVRFLQMTNRACIVLTAALIVSFPAVSCTFAYLFTADVYFFSLLFAALAAYLAQRPSASWKETVLLCGGGAVLLAVSCGIYQAYVDYTIGLLLFDCILRLFRKEPVSRVVKVGVRYLVTILSGLLLYLVILKLLLWRHHTQLTTYRGMDQAFQTDVTVYLKAIPKAYTDVLNYFRHVPYFAGKWVWLPVILCLCAVALGAAALLRCRGEKDFFLRAVLVFCGAALLPAAVSFVSIITPNTDMYELMRYAYVLVFVFSLKLVEWVLLTPQRARGADKAGILALVLCAAIVWGNFRVSNLVYMRVQLCMENTAALADRVAARIESLPGYTKDTPVVFSGNPAEYGAFNNFPELSSMSAVDSRNYLNWYTGHLFLERFTAFSHTVATEEEKRAVHDSGVLEEMPAYPDDGAVRMYEGMAVVKLGEAEELW